MSHGLSKLDGFSGPDRKTRDVLNRIGVLREKRADALGGIDGYGFELVFCHPGPDQKLNGKKNVL